MSYIRRPYRSGFRRRYTYNNWRGSAGASNRDGRSMGRYTHHDRTVLLGGRLEGNVSIITWMGDRPICFVHGGIFYFGRTAISLLENQVKFMLPQLPEGDTTDDSFSFGIVAHPHAKDATVVTSQRKAYLMTYNFIVSNIVPVLAHTDDDRVADMFTVTQEATEFLDRGQPGTNRADEFMRIFLQPFRDVVRNPFNPDNDGSIRGLILSLVEHNFIVTIQWRPDYRTKLRGWTSPFAFAVPLGGDPDGNANEQQQARPPSPAWQGRQHPTRTSFLNSDSDNDGA